MNRPEKVSSDFPGIIVVKAAMWIALSIGVIFMLGTMLVIVTNVISRIVGKPILGALEIASLCLVPTIAITIGYTAFTQSHIVVDMLTSRLKKRRIVSTTFSLITALFSVVFWALVAWKSTEHAIEKWGIREATEVLKLPVPPFRLIWGIGVWILVLVLCYDIIRFLKKRTKG